MPGDRSNPSVASEVAAAPPHEAGNAREGPTMTRTTEAATAETSRAAQDSQGARIATAAAIAGLVGAVVALLPLVVPPAVPRTEYGYPYSHVLSTVVQILLFLHHVAAALVAPLVARLAAPQRLGRSGAIVAAVGLVLLGVQELLAIAAVPLPADSAFAGLVDTGFGLWNLAIAAGFILLGVAVVRARRWHGWRRALPLVMGCYMIAMIPALLVSGTFRCLALAVWSLLFTALGVAVLRSVRAARP